MNGRNRLNKIKIEVSETANHTLQQSWPNDGVSFPFCSNTSNHTAVKQKFISPPTRGWFCFLSFSSQRHHARFFDGVDVIEKYLRIQVITLLTDGDMQMLAGAAPCTARYAYHFTSLDTLTFRDRSLWEVAITDGEVAVPERDIPPWHLILPDSYDFPLQHRIHLGTSGVQVDAVMKLPLPRERILAITVWRIDLDMWERIAHAQIACYLLFSICVRTRQRNLVGCGFLVFRGNAFGCCLFFIGGYDWLFHLDLVMWAGCGNRIELCFCMDAGQQ